VLICLLLMNERKAYDKKKLLLYKILQSCILHFLKVPISCQFSIIGYISAYELLVQHYLWVMSR
jgi:hypothetical protein